MPAVVVIEPLQPEAPETEQLLVGAREKLRWGAPLEIGPEGTVELFFVADDWEAGAQRVEAALAAAAGEQGLDWTDYLLVRPARR